VKHFVLGLFILALFVPGTFAQDSTDHINAGIYGNFSRLGNTDFAGVGARLSVNIFPAVQLEAESAYNFDQAFVSGFNDSRGSVAVSTTNARSLDFLVGPKLMTNKGPVRLFVTVKGGFENFLVSSAPATVGTFTNTFAGINGHQLDAVLYPGVGAEAFWGPFGLRVDAGDEIYYTNGAHHGLKLTFGPTIRF
jgi:hypothetical protein